MQITLALHYRGPRTQRMNELQDNATRYLEEFVKDDLRFFGLPAPEECGCTWRSGIIRCSWTVGTSSYLQRYIRSSFQGIHRDTLPERSISAIELHIDGKQHWVRAPAVRALDDNTQHSRFSHTRESYHNSRYGEPPSVTNTINSARKGAVRTYRSSRSESPPHRSARRRSRSRTRRERDGRSPTPRFEGREHTPHRDVDRSRPEHRFPRSPPPLRTSSAYREGSGVKSDEGKASIDAVAAHANPPIETSSLRFSDNEPARTGRADRREGDARPATRGSDSPSSNTTAAQTMVAMLPSERDPVFLSSSTSAVTPGTATSDPMRDLWNLRREISALSAREEVLAHKLQQMGVRSPPASPSRHLTQPEMTKSLGAMEDEIWELRAQVKAQLDARTAAEKALEGERRSREHAEAALQDIRRECYVPFVAPAIADAFLQISHLTDKLVSDV